MLALVFKLVRVVRMMVMWLARGFVLVTVLRLIWLLLVVEAVSVMLAVTIASVEGAAIGFMVTQARPVVIPVAIW